YYEIVEFDSIKIKFFVIFLVIRKYNFKNICKQNQIKKCFGVTINFLTHIPLAYFPLPLISRGPEEMSRVQIILE
ncbi:MAG: hypothetical protein QUS12_14925, partial [Methanosarcina sp.]|nr:hypothetical protein [Methanosarcina sp.]